MAWRGRLLGCAGAAVGSFTAGCGWASWVHAEEEKPVSVQRTKPVRAVIVGGGCAGASLAHAIEHLVDVTLIDKKQYFEFTPMLKHFLLGEKQETAINEDEERKDWFRKYFIPHQFYLQQSRIITGEVKEVSPSEVMLRSGRKVEFDCLFLCMGSEYTSPWKQSQAVTVAQRAGELTRYNHMIARSESIAVIGGGAVGVENAAMLARKHPEKTITLVQSHQNLLPSHGPKTGHHAAWRLRRQGVDVQTLKKVTSVAYDDKTKKFTVDYTHADRDGKALDAGFTDKLSGEFDYVMDCRGLRPNTGVLKRHFKGHLDERGFVKVNSLNQLKGHPNIFALGDIARQPSALGRETGLAYVTDHVHGVASALAAVAERSQPEGGNAVYEYPYPMQIMHLSPWDHVGTIRALGEVRSLLGTFAGSRLNESFMEPFWQPRFKSRVDLDRRGRINEWLAERKGFSSVYEYSEPLDA